MLVSPSRLTSISLLDAEYISRSNLVMKSGKDSSQIHSSGGGHYKMEEANSSRMSMD